MARVRGMWNSFVITASLCGITADMHEGHVAVQGTWDERQVHLYNRAESV